MEHRDGSACTSYYPDKSNGQSFKWIAYKNTREFVNEFEERSKQLDLRVADIQRVIQLINDLQNGKQVKNALKLQIDKQRFAELFDLNNTIVMGHSFGSATAIRSLNTIKSLRLGICLDTWMFPITDINPKLIKTPILFLNMDLFESKQSLRQMSKFFDQNDTNAKQRKVLTLRETGHLDLTDFNFALASIFKSMSVFNPDWRIIDIHDMSTALILQFIEDKLQSQSK